MAKVTKPKDKPQCLKIQQESNTYIPPQSVSTRFKAMITMLNYGLKHALILRAIMVSVGLSI